MVFDRMNHLEHMEALGTHLANMHEQIATQMTRQRNAIPGMVASTGPLHPPR